MVTKNASVVDLNQYKFDQAEKEVRLRLVDYSHRPEIQAQIGEAFYIWKKDPELLSKDINEDDVDDLTFAKFFDWFIYDFKLLDSGKTVIERFYEEERTSLSDTEQVVLEDWRGNLYSFFEVEEVFPKEGCRIKDIFTGEIFQVKDFSSSEKISKADIIGGRPLKTGTHHYFSSVILVYPSSLKPLILDYFENEFKEYKKTFGRKKTAREYLKDWGFLIGHHIEDIAKNPSFLTPEGDELLFAKATYKVKNHSAVLKKLRAVKTLEEISGGTDDLRVFTWTKGQKEKLWGTIEVEKDNLSIECYSLNFLAETKEMIEEHLSGLITLKKEDIKKLESLVNPTSPGKTKKLPPGIKNRNDLDSVLEEYYNEWLDTSLQALEGKTPKEATKTKDGREKLHSILEELQSIYEYAKDHGEPYYDVGKLRKKLRLE